MQRHNDSLVNPGFKTRSNAPDTVMIQIYQLYQTAKFIRIIVRFLCGVTKLQ